MRPLRALFVLALMLPLAGGTAHAQQAKLLSQKVEKVQNRVAVTWEMEVEVGVKRYELRRRTSASPAFVLLATISPQGPSRPYQYVDAELYKDASQMADYELTAVLTVANQSEVRQTLFTAQVNYTSTGLRRTWGSLKAMFQ